MGVVVNTTNGVERKNRDFKHEYLKPHKDNSLSGMITVLIEKFGPDTYGRYVERNQRRSSKYQKYEVLPLRMHGRPKKVVDHLIAKMSLAKDISPENVVEICAEDTEEAEEAEDISPENVVQIYAEDTEEAEDISPENVVQICAKQFSVCKDIGSKSYIWSH